MDAKELRIGDIVKFNKSTNNRDAGEVGRLELDDFYSISEGAMDFDDIEPLPLMDDLVLQCGFRYDDELGCNPSEDTSYEIYRLNGFLIGKNERGGWYRWQEGDMHKWYSSFVGKEIKYLHQLQNLYFLMEEEELPINL